MPELLERVEDLGELMAMEEGIQKRVMVMVSHLPHPINMETIIGNFQRVDEFLSQLFFFAFFFKKNYY
jgi:hypothetical protein